MKHRNQVGRHSELFSDGLLASVIGFIILHTAFLWDLWVGGASGGITLIGIAIACICLVIAIDKFHAFFTSRECPRCWTSVRIDRFQCHGCGERFVGRP